MAATGDMSDGGRAMNKLELLQKVPTFARLTNDQLALLARSVGTQVFERDEAIFHQGSIGSTLYIIVHGQVRIFTTSSVGDSAASAIDTMGPAGRSPPENGSVMVGAAP